MACKRQYRYLSLVILSFSWVIAFPIDSSISDTATVVYQYRQSRGTTVDTVYRSIASDGNETIIGFKDPPNIETRAICNPDFRIKSWHFENKETGYDVNAARFGDTIKITGRMGKKTIQKSHVIDASPWYQAMEFSLQAFLEKGIQTCGFWMIRPTDMNVFKMAVQRETVDTIQVNGRPEQAIRVTLSPGGLAGRFWKASYWYRKSDYSFLKSALPQGIPGKPPIIIESMGFKRPER
jgi:hypothetical protein